MARHLAPFSCRQTIAEIVRRRSWGGVLPLGRHASISGSRSIHAPSVSIALSSFQEGQNARLHNRFKREQALALHCISDGAHWQRTLMTVAAFPAFRTRNELLRALPPAVL